MKNIINIKKINLDKLSKKEFSLIKSSLPGINLNKWKWEYLNSSQRGYVFIAEIDGNCVAHNSFIVSKFIINNKKVLVAKSEGSYADSKLIKKVTGKNIRVFKEVVKQAIKIMKKEKIFLAYGFPNNLGHKSYIYGGYSVSTVDLYVSNLIVNFNYHFYRKNNNLSILSRLLLQLMNGVWRLLLIQPLLLINYYKNSKLVLIDEKRFIDIVKLFNQLKLKIPKNYLMVDRNQHYLNWRYLQNPYHKYFIYGYYKNNTLEGYIIYNIINSSNYKNIEIKDMLFKNERVLNIILSFIIKLSVKKNISVVTFWEDVYAIKNCKKIHLIKNGFLKSRILTKKSFILNPINFKNATSKVVFELKKHLERS